MRRVPYNCTSTAVPLTRDINLLGSGRTHGGPYPGFPDQNLEGVNRKPNHQSDKHICRSMIAILHVFGTANLNTLKKVYATIMYISSIDPQRYKSIS